MEDLQRFAEAFEYDKGSPFDGWRNIKRGDCDDYAYSMALIYSGGSLLRLIWNVLIFKVQFWRVHSTHNDLVPRHLAVFLRGHGWTDSTFRGFRETVWPHKKRWPMILPLALLYILLGKV